MKPNLNKIAQELYGKIETRFSNIKIGDENAGVLSRKEDIPEARFFEFEYVDNGIALGTIAITLDEDDGVVVQVSGNLANRKHSGAYKFIRSFRQFAKNRLLNFDVQNIGKNNLDKRDYTFQAKAKELPPMEPIMESKMYGTARMSYQDLGEATLIIKHSQPVNTELPAGRTMHIESIYVENADGERFKYPFKHLGGARALAEHLKHGGIPYDAIGKHITSLSEELAQLRKFKGYVGRNEALSEAMGDITSKVMERIDQIKKEVTGLSRKAYYEQFAESFAEQDEQMIPEDIMSDWIDRLTIRTFNEELKTAFPYIFKLVSEADIPVKELSADDILSELSTDTLKSYKGKAEKDADEYEKAGDAYSSDIDEKDFAPSAYKKAEQRKAGAKKAGDKLSKKESVDPEDQFESFMDSLVNEDEAADQGKNRLFSKDVQVRMDALEELKGFLDSGLKPGINGVNAIQTLKGIIDSDEFATNYLTGLTDNDDAGTAVKLYLQAVADGEINEPAQLGTDFKNSAQEILATKELDSSNTEEEPVGGEDVPETPPAPAEAPPAEAPPIPPEAGAAPEAPPAVPPAPPAPVAEATDTYDEKTGAWKHEGDWKKVNPKKNPEGKVHNLTGQALKKTIEKAKKAGATLETQLDFGHGVKSLAEIIDECGLTPMECGFEQPGNPTDAILDSISGFWSPQKKNFTVGGTKAKIKVLSGFKNGEFPGAKPQDVKDVIDMIEKLDPSTPLSAPMDQEVGNIRKLAGVPDQEMSEEQQAQFDLNTLMAQLQALQNDPAAQQQMGDQAKQMIGQQMQKVQKDVPNQTVQFPGGQMNPQELMKGILSKINFGG